MDWDGEERRKMDQDWIDRDRLLTQTHDAVMDTKKFVERWTADHDAKDDKRFKEINQKILYGAICLLLVAFGTGTLPSVLAFFKR